MEHTCRNVTCSKNGMPQARDMRDTQFDCKQYVAPAAFLASGATHS